MICSRKAFQVVEEQSLEHSAATYVEELNEIAHTSFERDLEGIVEKAHVTLSPGDLHEKACISVRMGDTRQWARVSVGHAVSFSPKIRIVKHPSFNTCRAHGHQRLHMGCHPTLDDKQRLTVSATMFGEAYRLVILWGQMVLRSKRVVFVLFGMHRNGTFFPPITVRRITVIVVLQTIAEEGASSPHESRSKQHVSACPPSQFCLRSLAKLFLARDDRSAC